MDRLDTQSWYRPASSGSGKNTKPDVLVAKFGRGYEQRSGDGPAGTILPDYPLIWANIPHATAKQYDDFFAAQGAWKKFQWQPDAPYGTAPLYFICEEWHVAMSGGVATVTATLMQRPG